MDNLVAWLYFVAFLRAISVYIGLADGPLKYREKVFSGKPKELNELGARLFGVWTMLSGYCCVMTAMNMDSRPMFITTLVSFVIALGFFAVEFLVHKTSTFKNIIPMLIITGVSIPWLWVRMPKA